MNRKYIAGPLLLAALFAACSRPASQPQPSPAASPPATAESPARAAAPSPAPAPTAQAGEKPAAAAFEQVRLQPGEPLPGPGLYFLNTASGSVEGWRPVAELKNVRYAVSEENRFAGVAADEGLFLIDRQAGKVAPAGGMLLDSRGGRILLVEPLGNLQASGRYLVLDTEQRVISHFELPQSGRESRALISPDGAHAYITTYDVQGEKGYLYLADLAAGKAELVSEGAYQGRGIFSDSLVAIPGTNDLLYTLRTHDQRARGEVGYSTLVMRLDWQGRILMEKAGEGHLAGLSPDGRHALWQTDVAGYPGAVVLSDLSGSALFRAKLFSQYVPWLADGSAFLASDSGVYRQITVAGEVKPFALCEKVKCLDRITPAPNDANRFLIGRLQVVSADGKLTHLVRLASDQLRASYIDPWGQSSRELRIAVERLRGGDGWDGFYWSLPLQIERPPFDDRLVVKGTGDCLNLRERPELGARVRGCLPDGTPLTVARSNDRESSLLWGDGGQWVYVKAEGGQEGWVSIGSGFVGWLR